MAQLTFTKLERYELKYHIPMSVVPLIDDFLRPWCGLDAHSESSSDGFYWVTSLYLDSPQLTFFRWKEAGLAQRFNMRIRAYGMSPAPDSPRFFEVKMKKADIVTKTRGTLKGGDSASLWQRSEEVLKYASSKDRGNLEKFLRLSTTYNSEPHLLTQYRRKAWFGLHEDYARITVDTGMRWREETGFCFDVDPCRMRPSDTPDYFRPGANAVLELKCPKAEVPWWMLDLIRMLNLDRTSFSKYGAAVRESMRMPTLRNINSNKENLYESFR